MNESLRSDERDGIALSYAFSRRNEWVAEVAVHDRMDRNASRRPRDWRIEPELPNDLSEPRLGGDDDAVSDRQDARTGRCREIDALMAMLWRSFPSRPECTVRCDAQ